MNQAAKKDIKELIDLLNEILALIEEVYTGSEDEAVRKDAVEHTAATLDTLTELQRVDKLIHQREMNDIEAAQVKKIKKVYLKQILKRKMDIEVWLSLDKI